MVYGLLADEKKKKKNTGQDESWSSNTIICLEKSIPSLNYRRKGEGLLQYVAYSHSRFPSFPSLHPTDPIIVIQHGPISYFY